MDELGGINFKERGDAKTPVKKSEHVGEAAEKRIVYPGSQEDEGGEGFEGTGGAFLSLTKNWK